jgi:Double zinc ribbon
MDEDICETCGERNVAGAQFCTSCGAYLGWDGAAKPAPSDYVDQPANSTSSASVTTALPTHSPPPGSRSPEPPARSVGGTPAPAVAAPHPGAAARPGQSACPRCGTVNEPTRRFCRKCAEPTGHSTVTTTPSPNVPASVDTSSERAARSAYRRSLPMRYRVLRVASGVAAVAVVIAFFAAAGRDPLGWTRRQVYALRGTVVPVSGLTAVSQGPVQPGDPAANAVDQNADTAWAIPMKPPGTVGPDCGASASAMVITISGAKPVTIRALDVTPGLLATDPNWQLRWIPQELEIQGAGGSCQRVTLKKAQGTQRVKIKAVTTNLLRVSIVAALQPPAGGTNVAGITEIRLMKRPG